MDDLKKYSQLSLDEYRKILQNAREWLPNKVHFGEYCFSNSKDGDGLSRFIIFETTKFDGYFYYSIFDKEKGDFIYLDNYGTRDYKNDNRGPWFIAFAFPSTLEHSDWLTGDKKIKQFIYHSENKGCDLAVILDTITGRIIESKDTSMLKESTKNNIVCIKQPMDYRGFPYGKRDEYCYYMSEGEVIEPSKYGSDVEPCFCYAAQENGVLALHDKSTNKYFMVSKMGERLPMKSNGKTLGKMLYDAGYAKKSTDNKTYFWMVNNPDDIHYVVENNEGQQHQICLKDLFGSPNQEIIDYNYDEGFFVVDVKNKAIPEDSYRCVLFDKFESDVNDVYAHHTTKISQSLDFSKHITLSDILTENPELFLYLPSHIFNSENISSYISAALKNLSKKSTSQTGNTLAAKEYDKLKSRIIQKIISEHTNLAHQEAPNCTEQDCDKQETSKDKQPARKNNSQQKIKEFLDSILHTSVK